MRACKWIFFVGALAGVLSLSACESTTPSLLQTGKIRLKDQMVAETLDAKRVDPLRIHVIADHYLRNGKGKMNLMVSWLSGDVGREAAAQKQGSTWKYAFEQNGVNDISVDTVAIDDRKFADKIVITYRSLVAMAPKGCGRLPGYQGAETVETMDKYQVGCETQAAISRMIVDPSDLMGKSGAQDNDSRRSGALVEPYRVGTPNQPMKGYQASTIGVQ